MTERRGWGGQIEQRPHIRPPRSALEVACTFLTWAALLVLIAMTAYSWPMLPAIVPTHFGADGTPNAYGSKDSVLLLPGLLVALTLFFALLSRFPWAFNYPITITPENAERQYRRGRTLLAVVNTAIALTFAYIQWQTIQVARGGATGLGATFSLVAIFVFVVLAPIAIIALIVWWNRSSR
ncbi:MAG TPA: DUF1648 domain-containing protein [Ktedonobacterales bacterium]|nr:DUF1648 domain-containing protein [Ktedonobacterales bacterium]